MTRRDVERYFNEYVFRFMENDIQRELMTRLRDSAARTGWARSTGAMSRLFHPQKDDGAEIVTADDGMVHISPY